MRSYFAAYRRLSVVAGALLLTACDAPTSNPDPVTLAPPADTVLTPYAKVTRAVPLDDGRWAVVAPANETVGLVDVVTGSITRLGDDGNETPRNPITAFVAEDTLYVPDWGLRRMTLWSLGGDPIRAVSADSMVRGVLPRMRDTAGRYYLELSPPPRSDGSGNRDSAAVVRVDRARGTIDTVARLAPLDLKEVLGDRGRRFEQRIFSGTDAWGALPDGSVWVARVHHNRVDWRSPDGTWTQGQALPDRVLEVTRYDREMFVREFPPELRSMAERLPFAPIKPPFDGTFDDPDGNIWLVKSRTPADSAGRYHVVDREGRLLRDLRIPGDGRVIGASRDAALVAEQTREGVRLLRFALPAPDR